MKFRNPVSALMLSLAFVVGAVPPASADSGTFTRQNYQIVFFYDVSGGNAYSNQMAGRGSERLSLDAPGASQRQTAVGELYRKDFWSQTRLVSISAAYSDPARFSTYQSLSSSNTYATRAVWNPTGDLPGMPNGYSRRS